ncbi:hypothetical protein ABC345_02985 [Shouchella sp. 1P09AA]|uniref:hypothetical protein n=1 Tax=Bacillaceae TaxID=186817 RepID=UPI0011452850|nr:hypothetical protein [Bacillus sp. Marseille-P3800]
MRSPIKIFLSILMIGLAGFPFLVIYDSLSHVVTFLPDYDAPHWFVPAGFISIVGIVILAFVLGKGNRDERF